MIPASRRRPYTRQHTAPGHRVTRIAKDLRRLGLSRGERIHCPRLRDRLMPLLLDTHIVLWWLSDDPTLAAELKDRLDHEPDIYVSAATIWEVAIKQSIGKLKPDDLPERV